MEEFERSMLVSCWGLHKDLIETGFAFEELSSAQTVRFKSLLHLLSGDLAADHGGGPALALPESPLPEQRLDTAAHVATKLPRYTRLLEWMFEWMFLSDGPHGCLSVFLDSDSDVPDRVPMTDLARSADEVDDALEGTQRSPTSTSDGSTRQGESADAIRNAKIRLVTHLARWVIDELASVHRTLGDWLELRFARQRFAMMRAMLRTLQTQGDVQGESEQRAEGELDIAQMRDDFRWEERHRSLRLRAAIMQSLAQIRNNMGSTSTMSPKAIQMLEFQMHALSLASWHGGTSSLNGELSTAAVLQEVFSLFHPKVISVGVREYSTLAPKLDPSVRNACRALMLDICQHSDVEIRRACINSIGDPICTVNDDWGPIVSVVTTAPLAALRILAWERIAPSMNSATGIHDHIEALMRCLDREKDARVVLAATSTLAKVAHGAAEDKWDRLIRVLIKRIVKSNKRSLAKITEQFIVEHYDQYVHALDRLPGEMQARITAKADIFEEAILAKVEIRARCINALRKLAMIEIRAARKMLEYARQLCFDDADQSPSSREAGLVLLEVVVTSSAESCRVWLKPDDVQLFLPLIQSPHQLTGRNLKTADDALKSMIRLRLVKP